MNPLPLSTIEPLFVDRPACSWPLISLSLFSFCLSLAFVSEGGLQTCLRTSFRCFALQCPEYDRVIRAIRPRAQCLLCDDRALALICVHLDPESVWIHISDHTLTDKKPRHRTQRALCSHYKQCLAISANSQHLQFQKFSSWVFPVSNYTDT
jgi:hypothetical protein